jgi:ABC-2 type transport system permease protein
LTKILSIIWKDIRIRFTGWSEWLFFIILPVIFTVVLGGGTQVSSDSRVRLVVVDQARNPCSTALIDALGKSPAVRPELLPLNEAEDQLSQRQTAAVLIIPAGFDQAAVEQGLASLDLRQQPNNLDAMVTSRAVQSVTTRVGSSVAIANRSVVEAEKLKPFDSSTARQVYFSAALKAAQTGLAEAPSRITSTTGTTQDPINYNPHANSSAGQLITWVFVPLLSISGMFAYERQVGTLRRILVTPTQKSLYLFATIAGQVLVALVQMVFLVGFGLLVMKVNWGQSPAALALILFASALAAAALGTTLGTFVKTESQASGLSIMLGMVMALLGGCWYPIELFPQAVRTGVQILPTTWAMRGMLDIVLRGQGLQGVLPEAGVLFGMAIVLFGIGIWRFRYE